MNTVWASIFPISISELSSAITVTGVLAEFLDIVILFRGFRSHSLRRYPFFFFNIACSLVGDIVLSSVRVRMPALYPQFYWIVQFVTLLAACGIVLEIFDHVLSSYPGADKFARTASVSVFAGVCCFSFLYPALSSQPTLAGSVIVFERDVRTVQAIFFCVILLIVLHYGIRMGKNVLGLTAGYGSYILISLLSLAIRAYAGRSFDETWRLIQSIAYDACLVIWTLSFWTYAPAQASAPNIRIESDYGVLVSKTKEALGSMRSYLGRSIRPYDK